MRRLLILGLLLGCAYPSCFGQSPGALSPAPPPAKRQGFFDYALGKINPNGKDYGAEIESRRSGAVANTIDDLYFWSNVLTLLLLTGTCAVVLFQWRSADKREVIASSIDRPAIEQPPQRQDRDRAAHRAI